MPFWVSILEKDMLFADAEVGEDVAEDFVGGDFAARDFGQMEEDLADVLRDEVGWDARLEAFDDAVDGVESVGEGFVVTEVRYDDVGAGDVGHLGALVEERGETLGVEGLFG